MPASSKKSAQAPELEEIINSIKAKLSRKWDAADTLSAPSKYLAVYNQGGVNTYETYAVINDDSNYILLGSIVKRNHNKQIFIVNKTHVVNDDSADYYAFAPVEYAGDIYRSPIMPLECSGSKMKNITVADQRFVLDQILSDPDIDRHLSMGV